MRKIILASSSERRAEILRNASIDFDIEESAYQEILDEKIPPKELAEKLALGKALAVVARHSDAIIIAADTFIVLDGRIFGKPYSAQKAKEMLNELSGRSHSVLTGYAIIDTKNGEQITGVEETIVSFRELSDTEINDYVLNGRPSPLTVSGAYAIQSEASKFVTKIEGDYNNVMGLPLGRITGILKTLSALKQI